MKDDETPINYKRLYEITLAHWQNRMLMRCQIDGCRYTNDPVSLGDYCMWCHEPKKQTHSPISNLLREVFGENHS